MKSGPAAGASTAGASAAGAVEIRALRDEDVPACAALLSRAAPGVDSQVFPDLAEWLRVFPEGGRVAVARGALCALSAGLTLLERDLDHPTLRAALTGPAPFRLQSARGAALCVPLLALAPEVFANRADVAAVVGPLLASWQALARAKNLRRVVVLLALPEDALARAELPSIEDATVLLEELLQPFSDLGFSFQEIWEQEKSSQNPWPSRWRAEWLNPAHRPTRAASDPTSGTARVALAQVSFAPVASFAELAGRWEFFLHTSASVNCDFVLFPELLTNPLLPLVPAETPAAQAARLSEFTPEFLDFFTQAAQRTRQNIVAGSILTADSDGRLHNVSYLFHRDGRVDRQLKLHITPDEAHWWGVRPGAGLKVFDTDRGRVAILICYDIEFPELSRVAAAQGASLFFVPYNTDLRTGHLRVRMCAAARCVENHVYCALSGAVGVLPGAPGADQHFAQSAILTPSDVGFPPGGIAVEAPALTESLVLQDLDLDLLRRTRAAGQVRTWFDRRTDLYQVRYRDSHGEQTI